MELWKTNLEPHSRRVGILLRNCTSRTVKIEAKMTVAQIAAANIVPPMLAPHHDQHENGIPMHTHVTTVTEDKDQPA